MTEIKRVTDTRDKAQAVIVIGFPGTTLLDADRYPLELLQEGCSDLGSRLFLRIREKLGLAYYVGAQNFLGLAPGYFAFYVGTAPEKLAEVEKELLAEAELLRAGGLTDEELRRAKAKVIGQRKISRQDLGGYAMSVALNELYGLGYQYLRHRRRRLRSRHRRPSPRSRPQIPHPRRPGRLRHQAWLAQTRLNFTPIFCIVNAPTLAPCRRALAGQPRCKSPLAGTRKEA